MYDGKTGELSGEIGSPAHKGGIYDVGEIFCIFKVRKVVC